jgi:hypothetical protein
MSVRTSTPRPVRILHCPECCRDIRKRIEGKGWNILPPHSKVAARGVCPWSGKKGVKP